MDLLRLVPLSLPLLLVGANSTAQADWTRLYPAASPSARSGALMAFDSVRGVTVLFGGNTSTGLRNDTWTWSGSSWAQLGVAGPPARLYHAMAFDRVRGRVVLFGGFGATSVLDDHWEWDGVSWTQLLPATRPTARSRSVMTFDPVRGVVLLFGGGSGSNADLGDLWQWNGSAWTQINGPGPGGRQLSSMSFEPVSGRILLFGGATATAVLDDTWTWDGTAWQQAFPTHTPYLRAGHRLVTDEARQRVVLIGAEVFDPYAWEWDGSNWDVQLMASPNPRFLPGAAYDALRREVVVFGGQAATTNTLLSDTWVYRTDNPADYAPFGAGCAGSAGTPSLRAAPFSLPWLGDTFRARVDAVPAGSTGVFFVQGLTATAPVSLAPFGLVGCDAYVGFDDFHFVAPSGATAEWSVHVPMATALVGMQLFQQVLVLDSAAPGGGVVSNAATLTVGVR